MVLSKRERYIFLGVVVAGLAFGLLNYAIDPLLDTLAEVDLQKSRLHARMNQAANTLKLARDQAPRWDEMLRRGIKDDSFDADNQVVQAIHNWAGESGVTIQMVKTDHPSLAKDACLGEIAYQAAGTGTLSAISQMLWRMQYATIPLRITELQLASRKEAVDDLTFTLRLSTLYLAGSKRATTQALSASGSTGGGL